MAEVEVDASQAFVPITGEGAVLAAVTWYAQNKKIMFLYKNSLFFEKLLNFWRIRKLLWFSKMF